MATASKRRKFIDEHVYEEDDMVDDVFFSELIKHVVPTKVVPLAEYLDISEAEYGILHQFVIQKTAVEWVLSLWRDELDASFTVKQFVEEINLWDRKGFVEPGIWTDLKPYIKPHLLPTEGERHTDNDMIQGEILYSETNLTADILGKDGYFLSDFIKRQGDNPPLKKINLRNAYTMPESKWSELLQFTSACKYLKHLNLESCYVGDPGRYLAQSITSWGDDPPLDKLNLGLCSITEQVWPELLHSLSSCKKLTDLNLSHSTIGEAGRYLAQSITSWGDNPPLKRLNLGWCSIPEQVWAELLQSLSSCKQLTYLDLSRNAIGEAGRYLAQSIISWGDNPPLQRLHLYSCSIPEQVWAELFQSLSSCKQLSYLELSRNTIGDAGRYLAQSVTSWRDSPPLETLTLTDCSIPEQVWSELLQSLSSCKQLTTLSLSNNAIGEAGHFLAQSITSWGDNPPLKKLTLGWHSIHEQVCPELLQSLSSCKQLTDLNLSRNAIGEAGRYLAQSIISWGDDPPLERLNLGWCSIPEQVSAELLESLSSCRHLRLLNLSDNTLTGCLSSFLSDPNPGLTSLEYLHLKQTVLKKSDIEHLTHLIKNKKLSGLKFLSLNQKNWTDEHDELLQLKEACDMTIHLNRPKTLQKKNKQKVMGYTQEELKTAYKLTCKEDMVEVFNACMNLVGHHKAGMTSLATRLMGQEFREDVQSMGAISIQHLKSTFNINEEKMGKWRKTTLDSSSYMTDFSHAVLSRVKSVRLRKRRATQKQKLPPPDKNVTNTKSGSDIQKPGEESSHQPKKVTTNSLGMSESEINSDDQKKTNTTQDHTKPDTDKNRTQKQRGPKAEFKKVTVGDSSIPSLNNQMMEEILSYKNTFLEKQPDDNCMSICLRDFGGQNDLFATHDIFLDVEDTTLIVMDITKSLHQRLESNPKLGYPNTPAAVLHYWLNSIHVKTSQEHIQPNVALVLTHRDMIQDDNVQSYVEVYIKGILRTLEDTPYAKFLTKDNIYVVDSKSGTDTEFQNLKNNLFPNLSQQSIWGKQVPVRWMKLKADIIEKTLKEDKRLLSLADVIGQAKQYGINDKETESFLKIENTFGNFKCFSEPELNEMIFTDLEWLVDKVTTLTAYHKFQKKQGLKANTVHAITSGYVTRNGLEEIWKERKVEYLIQLMVALNLIIHLDESGGRYIIPCMLPQQNVKTKEWADENMELIYSEFHKSNAFLIKTLHRLMSECSKLWKLCTGQNHPSCTDASFEMAKGIKLVLTLVNQDSLQISILCSRTVLKQYTSELVNFFREPRRVLSTKIEQLGIAKADTFYTLCPYSKSTDIHSCLVQMKEYQHPTGNKFSFWTLKPKCELHQGVLRKEMVPSLLMLSSDAGGQVAKETVKYQSRHDFQRQIFPISIQNNGKEFFATLTSGAACLLQDTGSNISIEVSKGTRAVIKQHVHTNLETLGFATSSNECIVSPVVTVHTMEIPSAQDAVSMNEKKETGDDRPIELEPLSAIMPRKLIDQSIKFKPSSLKEEHSDENQSMKVETVYPGEAGDTDDDQPMKLEPLSPEETGDTDDDQSMKLEPLSPEEAGDTDDDQPMKPEPLSPEEARNTNDDQPMKHEPLSTEEGRDPDVGQPIKLEPLSPEEARHTDDDQSKKLESVCPIGTGDSDGDHSMKSKPGSGHSFKQPREFYPLPPKVSFGSLEAKSSKETQDSDGQLKKREPLSEDEAQAHSSVKYQTAQNTKKVEETDFHEGHSIQCYTEQPQHFSHKNVDEESFYNFKLTIPHYVNRQDLVPLIQVKWGNIQGKLREMRKGKSEDKFEPYCEVYNHHVVAYADHFCDVVCTCPEKVCASKILAFPFGQIESKTGRKETHTKVKTYVCNHLYQDESLRKKLQQRAADFGMDLLEELVVPVNPAADIMKCKATVRMNVTDTGAWGPSLKNDGKWNAAKSQMIETTNLSDMMYIVKGHLCKSNPFDAANFGLKATGAVETFHGNMTVNVSGVKGRPRNTDIWIPPPQARELVRKGHDDERAPPHKSGTRKKRPQMVTDEAAVTPQEVEHPDMELTEPSPEEEYPEDTPSPAKRTKNNHSSTPRERTSSTETSSVQSLTNDNSTVAASLPSESDTTSMDYLTSDTSSEVHPGTSGTPFFIPQFRPQLIHESRNVPNTNAGVIQKDPVGSQFGPSPSSGAVVPFNMQPCGFEASGYNNAQHSIVPRQSSQAVGPPADSRQYFTLTRQIETWTSGPGGVMAQAQRHPHGNLPLPDAEEEPPETPADQQNPWGPKLLMKVAGVITNEWELTQLGLNLDVDENEIKRIIADRNVDTKMAPFNVLRKFDSGSSQDENEKRRKLRQVLCDLGKRGYIVKLGI